MDEAQRRQQIFVDILRAVEETLANKGERGAVEVSLTYAPINEHGGLAGERFYKGKVTTYKYWKHELDTTF